MKCLSEPRFEDAKAQSRDLSRVCDEPAVVCYWGGNYPYSVSSERIVREMVASREAQGRQYPAKVVYRAVSA